MFWLTGSLWCLLAFHSSSWLLKTWKHFLPQFSYVLAVSNYALHFSYIHDPLKNSWKKYVPKTTRSILGNNYWGQTIWEFKMYSVHTGIIICFQGINKTQKKRMIQFNNYKVITINDLIQYSKLSSWWITIPLSHT